MKKKYIIPIITLMVALFSVIPCYAVSVAYESSFLPFNSVGEPVTMNGDVLTSDEGALIRFKGLAPNTTYTIFYYTAPATSVSDSMRLSKSTYLDSGKRGWLYFDGTYSSENASYLPLKSEPDISLNQFGRYWTIDTGDHVFSETGTDNNNYPISMTINGGFTIDFSKLFIMEGSLDDLSGDIWPTPTLVNQNITISPGYVLVADLGQSNNGTVHFAASGLPGSPGFLSSNKVWQTSVQYGQSLSIPSVGPISTSAFLSYVTWQPVNPNLLGVATIGRADIPYSSANGRYYTVVNPYQFMVEDGGGIKGYHTELNPSVTVAFSGGVYTYRLYKTSQLWNDVNITGATYYTPTLNDTGTEVVTYEEMSITDNTIVNEVPADSLPSGSISGSDGSANISLGGTSDIFGKSANNLQSAYSENTNFVNALGSWLRVFPPEIWSVLLTTALVVCGIAIVKAIL